MIEVIIHDVLMIMIIIFTVFACINIAFGDAALNSIFGKIRKKLMKYSHFHNRDTTLKEYYKGAK